MDQQINICDLKEKDSTMQHQDQERIRTTSFWSWSTPMYIFEFKFKSLFLYVLKNVWPFSVKLKVNFETSYFKKSKLYYSYKRHYLFHIIPIYLSVFYIILCLGHKKL